MFVAENFPFLFFFLSIPQFFGGLSQERRLIGSLPILRGTGWLKLAWSTSVLQIIQTTRAGSSWIFSFDARKGAWTHCLLSLDQCFPSYSTIRGGQGNGTSHSNCMLRPLLPALGLRPWCLTYPETCLSTYTAKTAILLPLTSAERAGELTVLSLKLGCL